MSEEAKPKDKNKLFDEFAGELGAAKTHKDRMAVLGQSMMDVFSSLADISKACGINVSDLSQNEQLDAYISAWRKLKREKEELEEECRKGHVVPWSLVNKLGELLSLLAMSAGTRNYDLARDMVNELETYRPTS